MIRINIYSCNDDGDILKDECFKTLIDPKCIAMVSQINDNEEYFDLILLGSSLVYAN